MSAVSAIRYPIRTVDTIIDGISMYLLLEYILIALILIAALLSALGVLHYNPIAIILSAVYLAVVCRMENTAFAFILGIPSNKESSLLTALILALLITPLASRVNVPFLTAAGSLAIASKYLVTFRNKHIFNPAAIALVALYFGSGDTASWWVGNVWLSPAVIAGGLLIAHKIRRLGMVMVFFIAALCSTVAATWLSRGSVAQNVMGLLRHSSLFFLGFVMLTEPLTMPATNRGRYSYAVLVGLLFPPQIHLFGLYSTPELALVIGNAYAFLISPKMKLAPKLLKKVALTPDIADFIFPKQPGYTYAAGQYVDLTLSDSLLDLPGLSKVDQRGNRRMFTLASSPTEDTLRFGIKFYRDGSTFKRSMLRTDAITRYTISPAAGDFVLPNDPSRKLVFIAGGIGVTPYRSMIKYLIDTNEKRDVALIYSARRPQDFVYTEVFDEAELKIGIRTAYAVQEPSRDWSQQTGHVTRDMIAAFVPDYKERLFYISGPLPMIDAVKQELRQLNVHTRQIKTDYFSGYA